MKNEENTRIRAISSAEMTAYWRSRFPQLSHDLLSERMVSSAGVQKAKEFELIYDFPLVGRQISVRAGYMLNQALDLLSTLRFDSCISLASGFSLLTYYIALNAAPNLAGLNIIDTDLPQMASERQRRLQAINNRLKEAYRSVIQALDLERLYQQKMTFKDFFTSCQSPIFIAEGITYFLGRECLEWIMNQIASYSASAIIFDYWPENIIQNACFSRVFATWNQFVPEQIKNLLNKTVLNTFSSQFDRFEDQSIQSVENKLSLLAGDKPLLIDPNQFVPARLVTARVSHSSTVSI